MERVYDSNRPGRSRRPRGSSTPTPSGSRWSGQVDLQQVEEAQLTAAENEPSVRLPAALREGYALLGYGPALTCVQDPLVPVTCLFVLDGILIFRRENQDSAFWDIPLNRIDLDDPPVVVQAHDGWTPFLDRMSTAWVELVLSEWMFTGNGPTRATTPANSPTRSCRPSSSGTRESTSRTTPCGPARTTHHCAGTPHRAELLRHDGTQHHSRLHARGHTAADLQDIRNDLPPAWIR